MNDLSGYLDYLKRNKSVLIAIILMAVLTLFNLMVNNSLAALICFITTVVVAYRGYQTYLNGPDDQDKTEEGSDQF
ncbi:MAG: hypothetical protein IKE56_08445 [Lachnospiraceae bacterium]|jgi:hypothetical protein|nr:hypothetical protein [Lachnospiraceae bacterium]MBR2532668.1 hypothetical protein [Lachnospiraceae bacterium]